MLHNLKNSLQKIENRDTYQLILTTIKKRGHMDSISSPNNLLVANLKSTSLEDIVRKKLEFVFEQQEGSESDLSGIYNVIMGQTEKPLLELVLKSNRGNQVKSAQVLGINRNTLKKKIDLHKLNLRSYR